MTEGLRDEKRKWLFLRAGSNAGVFVLQQHDREFPKQHFAFIVQDEDLAASIPALEANGIEVEGLIYHDWVPARSLYFSDPVGNDLELCAPLSK